MRGENLFSPEMNIVSEFNLIFIVDFTGPEEEDVEEYIPDIEKEKREQIEEEIKLAKIAGEGNKEETVKQNDEK